MARFDPFLVGLALAAGAGVVVPVSGGALEAVRVASLVVIAGLFGLYGLRLSTGQALEGLTAWRPHLAILAVTFVAFPLMGLLASWAAGPLVPGALAAGILLLTLVPSTVQSAVAFTGIAGGDSALAVVSASLSNLVGVWMTPLLVAVTMSTATTINSSAIIRIVELLFVPFLLGQLLRPLFGRFVEAHDKELRLYDRGSILLVVYSAFSAGTIAGVWGELTLVSTITVLVACGLLLAGGFAATWLAGRPFSAERRIAITFCGTNKSVASGLPMAALLFGGSSGHVALLVVPLMMYHFSQLFVCSTVASRWARQNGGEQTPAPQ